MSDTKLTFDITRESWPAQCGCTLHDNSSVLLCPLHAGAQEFLDACKEMASCIGTPVFLGSIFFDCARSMARTAIAKYDKRIAQDGDDELTLGPLSPEQCKKMNDAAIDVDPSDGHLVARIPLPGGPYPATPDSLKCQKCGGTELNHKMVHAPGDPWVTTCLSCNHEWNMDDPPPGGPYPATPSCTCGVRLLSEGEDKHDPGCDLNTDDAMDDPKIALREKDNSETEEEFICRVNSYLNKNPGVPVCGVIQHALQRGQSCARDSADLRHRAASKSFADVVFDGIEHQIRELVEGMFDTMAKEWIEHATLHLD